MPDVVRRREMGPPGPSLAGLKPLTKGQRSVSGGNLLDMREMQLKQDHLQMELLAAQVPRPRAAARASAAPQAAWGVASGGGAVGGVAGAGGAAAGAGGVGRRPVQSQYKESSGAPAAGRPAHPPLGQQRSAGPTAGRFSQSPPMEFLPVDVRLASHIPPVQQRLPQVVLDSCVLKIYTRNPVELEVPHSTGFLNVFPLIFSCQCKFLFPWNAGNHNLK